jgi:hypothetical protein
MTRRAALAVAALLLAAAPVAAGCQPDPGPPPPAFTPASCQPGWHPDRSFDAPVLGACVPDHGRTS